MSIPEGYTFILALFNQCWRTETNPELFTPMRVFHLPSDWAETSDLARTARGRLQAQRLLGLVLDANLTCGCYQC